MKAHELLHGILIPLRSVEYRTKEYSFLQQVRGNSILYEVSIPEYYAYAKTRLSTSLNNYQQSKTMADDFDKTNMIDLKNSDISFLRMLKNCTSSTIGACSGMEMLDSTIAYNARSLLDSAYLQVTKNTKARKVIENIIGMGLTKWHTHYSELLSNISAKIINDGQKINTVLLILSIVLIIAFGVSMFTAISSLQVGYSRNVEVFFYLII